MQKRNKLTKSRRQQYLIIALCSISDCLYRELVENKAYSTSSWKRLGVPRAALNKLRGLIEGHGKCLEAMHKSIDRDVCPDPPCLDEEWLEGICRAALQS